MSDSNATEGESRADEALGTLAERIEARARGIRMLTDLVARQICCEEPPKWGTVIGWLDGWSLEMQGWAREAQGLAAKGEF